MVPHHAEHSLVVVGSRLRVEFYDDPGLRMRLHCSLSAGKREDIRFVSEELEGCWLVAFINDVQEPVRHRCQLHLSEMD